MSAAVGKSDDTNTMGDEILFQQPESSHLGDCPICCLPLPLDLHKFRMMSCCSKRICIGCSVANQKREINAGLELGKCLFCRKAAHKTEEEINERVKKRIEANDPAAISQMGTKCYAAGNYKKAFKYFTRAADLGDAIAHHHLSNLYRKGEGVKKDEKKSLHHAEQASIGGHPDARHNLGIIEYNEHGRVDRAVKHWVIASKLGVDMSLNYIKRLHKSGVVSKEDLAAALRGHYAAINATKSAQREEAVEYYRMMSMGRIPLMHGQGGRNKQSKQSGPSKPSKHSPGKL